MGWVWAATMLGGSAREASQQGLPLATHCPQLLTPVLSCRLPATAPTLKEKHSLLPHAGRHFGLFVTSPFTQPAVVEAATHFGKADCVQPRLVDATQQQQQPAEQQLAEQQRQQPDEPCEAPPPPPPLLGKLPLRHAFPELPGEQRWRGKDPIEVGCGTTELGDRTWLSPPQPGRFSGLVRCVECGGCRMGGAAVDVRLLAACVPLPTMLPTHPPPLAPGLPPSPCLPLRPRQ